MIVPSLLLGISTIAFRFLHTETSESTSNIWYVATDGNDAWSGTLSSPNEERTDGPFATIQRARDELRKERDSHGLLEGASVIIRGGTYMLSESLLFLPEDSRTEQGAIIYATAPGEEVFLKGSRHIEDKSKHAPERSPLAFCQRLELFA